MTLDAEGRLGKTYIKELINVVSFWDNAYLGLDVRATVKL